ncbi:MAG: diguanylate cyclase domain-containing protein [Acetatifactor sp.]
MLITDLEMTQATTEIYGGFICLMLALIIKLNGKERNSWSVLKWMFVSMAVNFFAESGAYLFRGNTDIFCLIGTRVCNFLVFLMNVLLLVLFLRYLYCLLSEKGVAPGPVYQKVVRFCAVLQLAILLSNLLTGWMYCFDDANYYHRGIGWYVYTFLNLISILTAGGMCIRYRKSVRKPMFAALLLFTYVPVLAIVLQAFLYGFSVANIGLFLAAVLMLFTYLREWSLSGDYREKNRVAVELIVFFLIMTISMSASIVSCILSIDKISSMNSKNNSMVLAHMISDRVESEFIKPIVVSETMANDYSLKEYLRKAGHSSPKSVEQELATYLKSIRDGFGYQMVFAVSDLSKAYYSYNGISKYVDPVNDEHDRWYSAFWEDGYTYDLDVDTDEANHWNLSVFINRVIKDDDGTVLGVCGVGVEMPYLQEIFRDFEEKYDVKIDLIDETGLIQVDSVLERIERDSLEVSLQQVGAKEFSYENDASSSLMIRYLESLNWYLVVEDLNPDKINVTEVIAPSIIIFLAGLMMMGIVFFVISIREKKIALELKLRRDKSLTDELTGLLNRRAYEEDCTGIESSGMVSNTTIVMMDLNGLKAVNDTYGHMAGDELIIGAANCISNAMKKYGKVYRIGGDEFVALLQCDQNQLEDALRTLNHMTKHWKGSFPIELLIAKGIVAAGEQEGLTFDQIKDLSDKRMYEDKEEHYRRIGKR